MTAMVVSVNVGSVREAMHNGRSTPTGIWKSPVEGRVGIRDHSVEGDSIANLENHGGEHKAVYAYSLDDAEWWLAQHGRVIGAGSMGENLSVTGVDVSNANVGDRWSIGSAVLEIAGPRTPCFKLGLRHDDQKIVDEFRESLRWGAYFRILTEGDVGTGDEIVITPTDEPTMSIAEIARIYAFDRERVGALLDVTGIAPEWISFANSLTSA